MGFLSGPSRLDRALDAFARRDWRTARRLLEKASPQERRAAGDYHLGLLNWRGLGGKRDAAAAVACFQRAAEHGHAAAQTAYGIALRSGIGVEKDDDAAIACFRSAIGAGDGDAMVELAAMSPAEEAHRLLQRAAEMGHPPAMARFADLLMASNPKKALKWLYADVALSGDEGARQRAASLAREMRADEIDAAQRAGRAYARTIERRLKGLE